MTELAMLTYKVEREIGGRLLSLETGKMARQAHGAVTVRYGDTVVLATVVTGKPREGIDFFPMMVDYREKMYAAGKFPGGFYKREGRPSTKEILTMRLIDRPIRPLFPEGFKDEVVIQCMVLSADPETEPDVLAMVGASAALAVSPIPFEGPTGAVRVGRVDGEFIINPTQTQINEGDMDAVLAGHHDAINMIEVGSKELSEQTIADGIAFGFHAIKDICNLIQELAEKVGTKKSWTPPPPNTTLRDKVVSMARDRLRDAKRITKKQERNDAVTAVYDQVLEALSPKDAEKPEFKREAVFAELQKVEEEVIRRTILDEGIRPDGRGMDEIRPITCEVGVLPRTHGSALFRRGETQALVVVTLGTSRDEQIVDALGEEYSKKFMLHYNFPPFSVGEVRKIMGPGRREIGHGALAERGLESVLPPPEKFPYTLRVVSDIMESNGSSSMASVCGGTLALMDGGVPIKHPVAGISIGLVSDGQRDVLLTDIIGEEDHFGDMDFKVAGSQAGITAVQLDLKTRGLKHELIVAALEKARTARIHILKEMLSTLRAPRPNISPYAPRLITIKINPEKIGKVIGPAGKGIRHIEATTGAKIDINDDGTVMISCLAAEGAEAARSMIEGIAEEVKIGKIYTGRVSSIKEFGAFIEVVPGTDGLCHISELSTDYVGKVGDVLKVGDTVKVKVIAIDEHGRVKLSRKQAMKEESQMAPA
jgi:polyribonucleotide nucleotidyltransferase